MEEEVKRREEENMPYNHFDETKIFTNKNKFYAIYLSTDFMAFYLSNSGPLILFQDPCGLFVYTHANGSATSI
jgi:hypothetical protein